MKNYFTLLTSLFLFLNFTTVHSQDIWKQTSGPAGLSLADFVITSDNVLVASAINSGIYFSKDHGASWEKRSIGLYSPDSYASSLAAGPGGIVYALIDAELYRMENNTNEWDKTIYKFDSNTKLWANPTNNALIVVTDFIGLVVHVSNDKGTTFKTVYQNANFDFLESASFNGNNNNYFVVYDNGEDVLYRLNDDGTVLKKIYTLSYSFSDIYWHPAGYIYILDPFTGLIRMDSLGNNQRTITAKAASANVLAVKPNGNLASYTFDADYESSDYGNNWTIKNSEIYKRVQSSDKVIFETDNTYLISSTCQYDVLSKTQDGGSTWTAFDPFFSNPDINQLFTSKKGNLFANTCYGGKFSYTSDKGDHWKNLNLPDFDLGFSDLVTNSKGDLYIHSYNNLYKSQDLGQHWDTTSIRGETMLNAMISDHANVILASGMNGAFITIDGGVNWKPIPSPPATFQQIISHPDGTLFGIEQSAFGGIYYSIDNGLNWSQTAFQSEDLLSFHITKDGTIIVSGISSSGTGQGTFVSMDKLKTWKLVSPDIYNSIISDNAGNLYGLESFGLCRRSIDGGKNWKPFLSGLPANGEAQTLVIDQDQFIYCGLNYYEVYKTLQPVGNPVNTNNLIGMEEVSIHPNPVNDHLQITIHSNQNFPLPWQLFDIHGSKILSGELLSEKTNINLESLTNGMYFLKFINSDLPVQKIVVHSF